MNCSNLKNKKNFLVLLLQIPFFVAHANEGGKIMANAGAALLMIFGLTYLVITLPFSPLMCGGRYKVFLIFNAVVLALLIGIAVKNPLEQELIIMMATIQIFCAFIYLCFAKRETSVTESEAEE